ncbi:tubulin--tyrosine ligase family protein [Legionella maioricensis]|uniref:Tubulin--tyrosine ligase family protein n=1 Tax=Legionella maioricensis TaxID=2896528 RepID=A0A9X2D0Y8_9GAMM|nr:tubulin--tyrosine ligase family protein [Legionella maioricensis]MCL9684489.1 tubulin--tyrosine ligase family protein [Legionella maioricensis]MCL9687917.1 tubulin--tyrosine ligase family protein [Legionella maioricensis]
MGTHKENRKLVAQQQQKSRRLRFCLRQSQSPAYYNLCHYLQEQGWGHTRFNWFAHFSEQNFQFDAPAAECLEYKHLLAQLIAQFCSQAMPVTYCINDQNWPLILNQLADEYYTRENQQLDHIDHLTWILKPALLNNGQHIKIFQKLSQLEQHYLSGNRLGGEHVLQRYLTHPHLLKGPEKGHKYSIRMFVVLTNYAGAYLYPQGYFNVGLHPYQVDNFSDLRPHLTNEHLSEDEFNVVQIRTEQYDLFKPFYPKIKAIVSATVNGLRKLYPQAFIAEKQRTLALFGFDFIVDSDMQVWLLEANHAPCFPTSDEHPLQNSLYYNFWQAFISSFVLPIARQQPVSTIEYQLFETVGEPSTKVNRA